MKATFFFLLLVSSFCLTGQTKNPFLNIRFDKVIFYDFQDVGEKNFLIVDSKSRPLQTITKQIQLDTVTAENLSTRLGDKKSYGKATAMCFEPHCGFVYFLKNKPVVQVLICLACNRLHSSISIPAQKQGRQGQGEDVYYILNGLSRSFRQFLNGLLIKNKFSHQIEPGSYFDK